MRVFLSRRLNWCLSGLALVLCIYQACGKFAPISSEFESSSSSSESGTDPGSQPTAPLTPTPTPPANYTDAEVQAARVDPDVFNADEYKFLYPDLSQLDSAALKQHWIDIGISEGRAGSFLFSAKEYFAICAAAVPRYQAECASVKARPATNYNQLIADYVYHGRSAGLPGSILTDPDIFDWKMYFSLHSDLQSAYAGYADSDVSSLSREMVRHWIRFGVFEGRRGSSRFHWPYYWGKLSGMSSTQALQPEAMRVSRARDAAFKFIMNGRGRDPLTESLTLDYGVDPLALDVSSVSPHVLPRRVGILYNVFHTLATMRLRSLKLATPLTNRSVENVLRAPAGGLTLGDLMHDRWIFENYPAVIPPEVLAPSFPWTYHTIPFSGAYCLYPGCGTAAELKAVMARHAVQLWNSGVDYVVIDNTNYIDFDEQWINDPTTEPPVNLAIDTGWLLSHPMGEGHMNSFRPTQMLFDTWAQLRKEGIMTPQIAIWSPVIGNSADAYPSAFDVFRQRIYENPKYQSVIMKHKTQSGAKNVYFYRPTESLDSSLWKAINTNPLVIDEAATSKSSDMFMIPLWAEYATSSRWSFIRSCTSGGTITTSLTELTDCKQSYTTTSQIGSSVAIGRSYQLGQASSAFQSTGSLEGLSFQTQFVGAMNLIGGRLPPNYLLLRGWNEFAFRAQWQQSSLALFPNFPAQHQSAMGINLSNAGNRTEKSYGDAGPGTGTPVMSFYEKAQWVDGYGLEYSTDLEPSREGGEFYFQLMRSCMRTLSANDFKCTNLLEPCCQLDKKRKQYRSIASFINLTNPKNYFLAKDPTETTLLRNTTAVWREVAAYNSQSIFSKTTSSPSASGPFIISAEASADRVALYRCARANGVFSYRLNSACDGLQKAPSATDNTHLVGYLSTKKSSATPRAFKRCEDTEGEIFVLDTLCPAGMTETFLGYVR